LTSVTIPASVATIGSQPFRSCSSLTSITVDNSSTTYSSLDGVLFNKLQTTLIQYPGGKSGSYTIPSSVTSISVAAFANCTLLTGSITIPDSVTTIDEFAFFYCLGLTSVTIPNSATIISSRSVFQSCRGLTSVTIPNLVTSIGRGSFQGCINLSSVTFTTISKVESIGVAAFQDCINLTSITIPNSVTSIGTNAFLTSGVTTVYISSATATAIPPQSPNPPITSPTNNPPGVAFFGKTVATVLPPL
jgi:hypothetical protein